MLNLKLVKPYNLLRRNPYRKISLSFICIVSFVIFILVSQTDKNNIEHNWHDIEQIYPVEILEDSYSVNSSNLFNPVFIGKEIDWQEITEIGGSDDEILKTKFFVYSAYLDFYENDYVLRVVSVTPSFSQKQLYCHIFDTNMLLLGVVPGQVKTTLCPQHSLMYSAAYILCKLGALWNTTDPFQIMKFVSVSPFSESSKNFLQNPTDPTSLSNILRIVTSTRNDENFSHQFAICVQPTFNYDNVFEFIQWMEIHKMMGVSHFTFYNISFGPRVSCILKSRAVNKETPVHVLKWTVPITNGSLLHVNAQIAQGNDCVFRYRGVSKYLVFVDLDEAIIPNYVYAQNYDDLIKVIDSGWKSDTNGSGPSVAQYQFRGGFFGLDFGEFPPPRVRKRQKRKDRHRNQVELEDLTIYKYITRQKKLFPYKERSKFITIPNRVIEPGVHSIDEAVEGGIELLIPYETAFLHHYRGYGCGNNCSGVPQEMDFTAHFFALKLLEKVRKAMEKLSEECDLRDVVS